MSYAALVERAAAQSSTMLVQYLQAQPGPPLERLGWLTPVMMQGLQQHPVRMAVMLEALLKEAVPDEVRQVARVSNEELRQAVRGLLAIGQEAGQVSDGDLDVLASLYLSLMNGIATTVLAYRPASSSAWKKMAC